MKFHRIYQVGKKSFFLKNIFFFVFYGCLSFFNEKYRYFSTFDQQILAEKLVFRILQHRFSRGSAIPKMIVCKMFEICFYKPAAGADFFGVFFKISYEFSKSPPPSKFQKVGQGGGLSVLYPDTKTWVFY